MNRKQFSLRSNITLCLAIAVMLARAGVGSSLEGEGKKPVPLVGIIGLIVREPVLKELGIDKDSQELVEIRALLKPFSLVLQQRLNHPTEQDREKQLTSQELYATVEAEFVEELKHRLKPEQFARLQQIHWQRWGLRSIEDPELANLLELTPDQVKRIAATRMAIETRQKELEAEQRDLRSQGMKLDEVKQKLKDLEAEQIKTYSAILNTEQLQKFEGAKGKPFEVPLITGPSNPQAGTPIRTRSGSLVGLAVMEPVLNELGLNPLSPEVTKLHSLARAHTQELRQLLQSKSTNREPRDNIRDVALNLQTHYDTELKNVLTHEQFDRLRQIHWQRLGAEALNDPEVIQALRISKDQQQQLIALNVDIFQKVRGLLNPSDARPVDPAMREQIQNKVNNLVREKEAKAIEILTTSQQEQWQEMKGKPFDVKLLRPAAPAP